MSGDQARVSVAVAVAPAVAFDIFTTEIDRWWRRGPRFRHGDRERGIVHLEPKLDGRLFESVSGEQSDTVFEVGRIQAWEPPRRFVFSWRNATFGPQDTTEVEVVFAPNASGTLVTVTHRGWASLRPDHPARHGMQGAEFARSVGLWWGDQLSSLRETCRDRS